MAIRIPTIPKKKSLKKYRIVTKPTSHAFCNGKLTEQKVVTEEWLNVALLAAELDPDVEQYFYEGI